MQELSEVDLPSKPLEIRGAILNLEARLKNEPGSFIGDSEVCPLKHTFAPGVYVREIFIPKGTLIVGKLHKHAHPNFLMSGDVSVLTEEGPKRLRGPMSMISPAGTKRVVYAHEDTVWITIHVTKKTSLREIEKHVIAKNYSELPGETEDKILEFYNNVSREEDQ